MNALILAAGYATRLYPLTLHKAKPLLDVAGKPMIEWVLDNLAPAPDLETVYVVTNNKFVKDFVAWADGYRQRHPGVSRRSAQSSGVFARRLVGHVSEPRRFPVSRSPMAG